MCAMYCTCVIVHCQQIWTFVAVAAVQSFYRYFYYTRTDSFRLLSFLLSAGKDFYVELLGAGAILEILIILTSYEIGFEN